MAIFRHAPGVLFEWLDDQGALIDANGTELVTVNTLGALVWEALDGVRTAGEIADDLARRFPHVSAAQINRDVEQFLRQMHAAQLVAAADSGSAASS